ncbi:MAG TPA: Holliday junction branch migration protein RuvA [Flavobacteriales bacterium]|jgi:Holliday junction DNA helicase RuvA|nr:Holliday junction branch migration protein RuvA [Flavobacteriales bacterium]
MIHHLRGRLIEKTPTYAVMECAGVGYQVHISLNTYEQLGRDENVLLHTHLVVREDAQLLYGFAQPDERELFLLLLGVSGVGANTARMILSAMDVSHARQAIQAGDVDAMKSVKGIGAKTAQRIIIDLQDKLGALDASGTVPSGGSVMQGNNSRQEALLALTTLGFDRGRCEKTLDQILKEIPGTSAVEDLIKHALKRL